MILPVSSVLCLRPGNSSGSFHPLHRQKIVIMPNQTTTKKSIFIFLRLWIFINNFNSFVNIIILINNKLLAYTCMYVYKGSLDS